jgi:hypothetical protein
MHGRKICAQIALNPRRSIILTYLVLVKAIVVIWQPCTLAVPILGGRITHHPRYCMWEEF